MRAVRSPNAAGAPGGAGMMAGWAEARRRPDSRAAGFNLVELAIVFAIFMVVALVGLPALQRFIDRSRLEGTSRETVAIMRLARHEAIKAGVPVIVEPEFASRHLLAFADVDRDGDFDPQPSMDPRATDYQLVSLPLPGDHVQFMGPSGVPGRRSVPSDAIDGFDTTAGRAIFEPDGSVRAVGAFRFGDSRGNYLEVRVGPKATGKVEVRKYNHEPPGGLAPGWYTQGSYQNEPLWIWYWEYKDGTTLGDAGGEDSDSGLGLEPSDPGHPGGPGVPAGVPPGGTPSAKEGD